MLEIKYKAFIRETKQIFNVLRIDLVRKEVEVCFLKESNIWFDFREVDLMRYTGLSDMNGEEIYVGYKVNAICIKTKKETEYEVVDLKGSTYFQDIKHKTYFEYDDLVKIKIIGNIYKK